MQQMLLELVYQFKDGLVQHSSIISYRRPFRLVKIWSRDFSVNLQQGILSHEWWTIEDISKGIVDFVLDCYKLTKFPAMLVNSASNHTIAS